MQKNSLSASDKAIKCYQQGKLFKTQGHLAAAVENFQQAILFNPDYAEAHYQIGNIFLSQAQFELAIENYRHAVSIQPDFADAYCNLGMALKELGDLNQATESYRHALAITPDDFEIYSNLAEALFLQNQLDAAIETYQYALTLNPKAAGIYFNLNLVFQKLGNLEAAADSLKKSLSLAPNDAELHFSLGGVLHKQGQLTAAIDCFKKSLSLNPNSIETLDNLFLTQLRCCDWSSYFSIREKIIYDISSGVRGYRPFSFLAISSSAVAQQQCAESCTQSYPLSKNLVWTGQRYQHDKIRIAYISADFREHPVSYLMAGLFENHDRNRFEIIAISLLPDDDSATGQRLKAAFDRFINVHNHSDYEVALLMRELEVDIAVDLMGGTKNSRHGIFAYRPAPVQINYIGHPGTMGTEYMDYIFADAYLIPLKYQAYYTEKVIYLPDCFQANDDKRAISNQKPSRAELGLPESGFVFCAFNFSPKITPVFFDVWMRLLKKIPDSVLWLVTDNPFMPHQLCNEAIKRGVEPERLKFATRIKYDQHLARFQLADLFLDTLPFNAGATASDALWAGVPVLTCSGEAFAARMAGSLLHAVGLPELITDNLEQYEALAFKLATTPAMLAEIRAKLAENRATYPLFNTARFCRHIEAAYITMWERYQRGESPESFAVPPLEQ